MLNRLLGVTENVAAVFLLLIALLTAGNAALRYTFSIQIPDWFDFSRLLQAIALFWGIAIVTFRGTHICVDIIWETIGATGKRVIDLLATAITVAFLAPLVWMVWSKVATTGTQTTSDLQLPLVPFYAVAAAGATAALVLGLARLWRIWKVRSIDEEATHGS